MTIHTILLYVYTIRFLVSRLALFFEQKKIDSNRRSKEIEDWERDTGNVADGSIGFTTHLGV